MPRLASKAEVNLLLKCVPRSETTCSGKLCKLNQYEGIRETVSAAVMASWHGISLTILVSLSTITRIESYGGVLAVGGA
jgi:hypothetical protein